MPLYLLPKTSLQARNTHSRYLFVTTFLESLIKNTKRFQRLLAADEESKQNVIQEINVLKKLSGHSNIIQFLTASYIEKTQTTHGQHEFLLVTELCTGTDPKISLNFNNSVSLQVARWSRSSKTAPPPSTRTQSHEYSTKHVAL